MTPLAARNARDETVFQDRAPAPRHSIVTTNFMGREIIKAPGLIRMQTQTDTADRLMRGIAVTSKVFHPEKALGHLSGCERQGVATARCTRTPTRSCWTSPPPRCS